MDQRKQVGKGNCSNVTTDAEIFYAGRVAMTKT